MVYRKLLLFARSVSFQAYCFAQMQSGPLIKSNYDLKVDVDSVFLNLSVRERANNRSLSGLQKTDFLVYEDDVLQDIEQFLPTEAPFNLLLLLDVSGSTGSYLKMMKDAAIEFTRIIKENDRIGIATFNSRVHLVQNFTSDRNEAERAIKHIRSGGGTAFYDALMTCINQYMKGMQGRNAIVVFTDGVDNQLEGVPESGSITRFDELYRRVQEVDAIVYTIFLNTDEDNRVAVFPGTGTAGPPAWPGGRRMGGNSFPFPFPFPGISPFPGIHRRSVSDEPNTVYRKAREQLMLISDQTGGRMYSPVKIDQLAGIYSEIADDLRILYQLGYNSTNWVHDGKWRNIRVEVQNNREAVIRTRRGYFATQKDSPAER